MCTTSRGTDAASDTLDKQHLRGPVRQWGSPFAPLASATADPGASR
eukprot:CAMPEP_0180539164 /NCGR_PEP_ID=MMETSP1036_2-20121128/66747_1 /TAXON_ID=632150 /ORGANISM="Azadinium spinosum, Strain 3D9" /LENGTH=45 /DNA_ID= /DNA_START= /DNA_END= /DNA_ORIENTATION=